MLDEPFSALDAFLKEKLQLELLELLSGYDKDILMVTHSRDEIYRFCEHMLIVEDGRQAGFGVTKEIFKNPGTPAAAKLTGCKNIEKNRESGRPYDGSAKLEYNGLRKGHDPGKYDTYRHPRTLFKTAGERTA